MAKTGDRNDPYASFNFLVEIDGISAGFSEVTGLDNDTDVIEYRNGNDAITKRKVPGLNKFTNITLKRGFTQDATLWQWRQKAMTGAVERKSGTITLRDEAGKPALKFSFANGWPSKWQGPAFHAGNSEVAIEVLEIACDSIQLDQG
jgi:phage tail-like protein